MADALFYSVDLYGADGLLWGAGGSYRGTRAALRSTLDAYRQAKPCGAAPTRARVQYGHRFSPGWYTIPDMTREGRTDA